MTRGRPLAAILPVAILVAMTAAAAQAKDIKIEDSPGYVDLRVVEIPRDADVVRDIDLGPVLLQMVAEADEAGDEHFSDLLKTVHSIRVKSFSFDPEDRRDIRDKIQDIEENLERKDWRRLILIRDTERYITVHTLHGEHGIVGVMAMVMDEEDEATFANLVGDIDFGKMFRLMTEMENGEFNRMMDKLEDRYDDDDTY
jgi:hypothetical protein